MSLQYRATINRVNLNAAFMSKTEDNSILGSLYTASSIRGGSLISAGNLDVALNSTIGGNLSVSGAASIEGLVGLKNTLTVTNASEAKVNLTGGSSTLNLNRLSSAFDNNLLFSTGGTTYWKMWQDNNQNLAIRDESLAKDIITLQDNTGRVGIGTSNPIWQLTVSNATGGDGTFPGGILVENTNATAGEAAIGFKNTSTGSNIWMMGVNQANRLDIAYGTSYSNANTFMAIDATGNVGIGNYTPTYKLDVTGTARITGATTLGSTLSVTGAITSNNSLTMKSSIFYDDTSRYWLATATNWGIYWNTTNNYIEFHGAGAKKAAVDLNTGDIEANDIGARNIYASNNVEVTKSVIAEDFKTGKCTIVYNPLSKSLDFNFA